jgi:hypothetical protein
MCFTEVHKGLHGLIGHCMAEAVHGIAVNRHFVLARSCGGSIEVLRGLLHHRRGDQGVLAAEERGKVSGG